MKHSLPLLISLLALGTVSCKQTCSAVKVGTSIKNYKANAGATCDLYFNGNALAAGIRCCNNQMDVASGKCASDGFDCADPANGPADRYNIPELDEQVAANDSRACNVYVRDDNIIATFTTACQ